MQIKKKNNYIINCFDKDINTTYKSNIRNIAQQKHFYETNDESIENELSKIEGECSKILNNIIKNKKHKLLDNQNTRLKLSYYLVLQFSRTYESRKLISDMNILLENEIKKENIPISEQLQEDFDYLKEKENLKSEHIEILKYLKPNIPHLINKKWCLIKNKSEHNFWTSDNPIVRYNPKGGNIGFKSDYINIYFPLSPKLCLSLLDYKKYTNFNEEKIISPENYLNNIKKSENYKITDNNIIDKLNNLQAIHSTRHIFSKQEDLIRIRELINLGIVKKDNEKQRITLKQFNIKDNENKEHNIIHMKYHQ